MPAVRRRSRTFSAAFSGGKFRDDSGLVGVVSTPLRGWIVPVGDAIPDRRGSPSTSAAYSCLG